MCRGRSRGTTRRGGGVSAPREGTAGAAAVGPEAARKQREAASGSRGSLLPGLEVTKGRGAVRDRGVPVRCVFSVPLAAVQGMAWAGQAGSGRARGES